MGYLKNKYTKEYFLGEDSKGNKLNYGATSSKDKDGNYTIRNHDFLILKKINFKDKNVLALGCGRSEELIYCVENGANLDYSVGVDFSFAAIKIAKELFRKKKLKSPKFYTEDVLDFVIDYYKKIKNDKSKKFDVVIMFDFIEHVPRKELSEIFEGLNKLLKKKCILVINTPAYKYDNDVLENGYDERNQIDTFDTSDIIPETKGMHCNKYSLISLQNYIGTQGFMNITEAHYFISEKQVFPSFKNISYYDRWKYCKENGFPLLDGYTDDIIEYPYPLNTDFKLAQFYSGTLEGVSLFLTKEYKEFAYPNGEADKEMMRDIFINDSSGKIIFDVGAFIGASSLIFSKLVGPSGKVLGFEPNSYNRNRSFLNLSQNADLSDRIAIFPFALGGENKETEMLLSSEIDSGYSSTSRLRGSHSKLHESELPDGFEPISVQVKMLDTFVKECKIFPDIIKVDIEGAEHDFLLGALDTIKKCKPIFYIEIHSEYCAIRCYEILKSEGYMVTVIKEEPDNRIMVKAEFVDKNYHISRENIKFQILKNQDTIFRFVSSFSLMIDQMKSDSVNIDKIKELENEKVNLAERNIILENKNQDLIKILLSIQNSKSWKLTKPLRIITNIIKKFLTKT